MKTASQIVEEMLRQSLSGPRKEWWQMVREDDLRETLNRAADEIAEIQSNPRAWLSWMVYLLERLESAATKGGSADKDSFKEMLAALQETIRNRERTGGW